MVAQQSPTCLEGELSTSGHSFASNFKVEGEILMKGEDEGQHCYLDLNLLYLRQENSLRFNPHVDQAFTS